MRRVSAAVLGFLAATASAAWAALVRFCKGVVAHRAELLTSMAFIGGWLLVTWGLASLVTPIVWRLSLGLLLISSGGIRLLWVFAWEGLYILTREELVKKPRRRRG